jgi:hypothetical protein
MPHRISQTEGLLSGKTTGRFIDVGVLLTGLQAAAKKI